MKRAAILLTLLLLVGVCLKADGYTGSGDSAVGAIETVAPVFSELAVEPAQAAPGDTVTITFSSSETMQASPAVMVNGVEADLVGEEKAGNYSYGYVVEETDALGMATIEINGSDLVGNPGYLSSADLLEIIPPMPLHGRLLFAVLLMVGLVAITRGRSASACVAAIVLLFAGAPALAWGPVVSSVAFVQQPDGMGGTEVVIGYDLDSPNGPCDVAVALSKDGGTDGFPFAATSVTGDLTGVSGGTGKEIIWQIAADYPDEDIPNARIRVTADDGVDESGETIMLPGDVPLEMVWIPAGSFMMGRYPDEQDSYDWEDPRHQVTVQGFWMGKYEITQQQWIAVCGSWPGSAPSATHGLGNTYPAYYVSWDDTKNFITLLNAHIVSSGQGPLTVRLPSEAEWEYACRAGTQTRFYFGDSLDCVAECSDCAAGVMPGNRTDYMWYCGNNSPYGTKVVGGKTSNAFGLYDMSGNVWEWCEDDWHEDYTGAPANGSAWVDSPRASTRRLRGGSWISDAGFRSASRGSYTAGARYISFGFRVAAVQ